MLKKGSKSYSVIHNKCPRCHEGDFFKQSITLNLNNNLKTNDTCDFCGLKYMIEPSFFYGAMYVSYAITVAYAVAVFVICSFLNLDLIPTVISIIVVLFLATPMTMRLSRLLYINMFVHYKKQD